MDTITLSIIKESTHNVARVAFNGIDIGFRVSVESLVDLYETHNIDVTEEISDLLVYELAKYNSTLTESDIKTQVTAEMKRLDLLHIFYKTE